MRKISRVALLLFAAPLTSSFAGDAPADWKYSQVLTLKRTGIHRLELSTETASLAQVGLADLRLIDPEGAEVPYAIDQALIAPARETTLDLVKSSMEGHRTIVEGIPPSEMVSDGFDAVTLGTEAESFLKPMTIEGSTDGKLWTRLAGNVPVYNVPGSGGSNAVRVQARGISRLRVILDDTASSPIRVDYIKISLLPRGAGTLRSMPVSVGGTVTGSAGSTVELMLLADNLLLDSLQLTIPEPTFHREVQVTGRVYSAGQYREMFLGSGVLYRVSPGGTGGENTRIFIGRAVSGRQLKLQIADRGGAPLKITGVSADLLPAALLFNAKTPGAYQLRMGNPTASPKTYDVAALREQMARAAVAEGTLGPIQTLAAYQAPAVLPQAKEIGPEIDISPWHYRKKVVTTAAGITRLELDLETLSHLGGRVAELRLVRDGHQVPYVVDHFSVTKTLPVTLQAEPSQGTRSAWSIPLPYAEAPLTGLQLESPDGLFDRQITVSGERKDERGEIVREPLGWGRWVRARLGEAEVFTIALPRPPSDPKLILETDNGDNAPLHLSAARVYFQAPSIVFKDSGAPELYLYYGQSSAGSPTYDLALLKGELESIVPLAAQLGPQEEVKVAPWWQAPVPTGAGRYFFWAALILVVLGLLIVIARLLPANEGTHT